VLQEGKERKVLEAVKERRGLVAATVLWDQRVYLDQLGLAGLKDHPV